MGLNTLLSTIEPTVKKAFTNNSVSSIPLLVSN